MGTRLCPCEALVEGSQHTTLAGRAEELRHAISSYGVLRDFQAAGALIGLQAGSSTTRAATTALLLRLVGILIVLRPVTNEEADLRDQSRRSVAEV